MMRTSIMPSPTPTLLAVLLAAACGDDLPDQPAETMAPPDTSSGSESSTTSTPSTSSTTSDDGTNQPGSSSSSDDGPSTVGIPDDCDVSGDCAPGELCVAPFDPELGPEGKGPNECVTECVVLMDELRWCLDATACCDPEAECTDRGYCELPGESTGDDGSSSSSDGGDTGTTGGG